jgi:AcrR family transcriptional regulator
MDAVEVLMRKEGYAQLSARKIAGEAGLNYQLVFYYFQTIEDLFLATYRRRTAQLRVSYKLALLSPRPFHALWDLATHRTDGVLSIEFMAMSNHYASIREESILHVQQIIDEMQTVLPSKISLGQLDDLALDGVTVAFLVSSIGNYAVFQESQGIVGPTSGIGKLVSDLLDHLEPA